MSVDQEAVTKLFKDAVDVKRTAPNQMEVGNDATWRFLNGCLQIQGDDNSTWYNISIDHNTGLLVITPVGA